MNDNSTILLGCKGTAVAFHLRCLMFLHFFCIYVDAESHFGGTLKGFIYMSGLSVYKSAILSSCMSCINIALLIRIISLDFSILFFLYNKNTRFAYANMFSFRENVELQVTCINRY